MEIAAKVTDATPAESENLNEWHRWITIITPSDTNIILQFVKTANKYPTIPPSKVPRILERASSKEFLTVFFIENIHTDTV